MKPKIIVIGSTNTDLVVRVKSLPLSGETVLGDRFTTSLGGKGSNQAIAAARLGADVTFVSRVGNDTFGSEAIKQFLKEGLDIKHLFSDQETPTGVALIMVDVKGNNSIAVAQNANLKLSPQNIKAAESSIKEADCVLLQLEIPMESIITALDIAKKHNKYLILNPAPANTLPKFILEEVNILTPNETELSLLSQISNCLSVEESANSMFIENKMKNLIVTLGKKGAYIAGNPGTLIPGFPVNAIDTIGAGDAFNAGLSVAISKGNTIEDAVRFANAVGAISTTKQGVQNSLPTLKEVERFLQINSNY